MKIVFFAHPTFQGHQSMPRFTRMLFEGMTARGHHAEIWMPQPKFSKLFVKGSINKWLGYLDQYIVFPRMARNKLKICPLDTLFVFIDNALGPWVPITADRPHIIHCHDFLAQFSALGEIQENRTSWTGRQYQRFIRRGYSKAKYFISVSHKTKYDLHRILDFSPILSEVVYNGLNQDFSPNDPGFARNFLYKVLGIDLSHGYLLHIGGNEWYKNKIGVIEIYNSWRSTEDIQIPLILIGNKPDLKIKREFERSPFKTEIYFLSGLKDEHVRLAYQGASVLLFPSLAEGFGWPIAEAMASGCPVITTDQAPMTEVGSSAAFYISQRPSDKSLVPGWANEGALTIKKIFSLSTYELDKVVDMGIQNAKRFDPEFALNKIETLYKKVLDIYFNGNKE